MFDEREFITKVEAADSRDFADFLRSPRPEEERALRAHFGDGRLEELQKLSIDTASRSQPKGNIVVLHGIMGSELAIGGSRIWVDVLRLIAGRFSKLKLDDQGRSEGDVKPLGLLKKYYGKQLLTLGQRWRVRSFAYDWRLDVFESAKQLWAEIERSFPAGEPVHLVAHSMGGLVARAFILRFPDRWKAMWDEKTNGQQGGRLIMLGTPNHGSFSIPYLYFGLNDSIRKLALLDLTSDLAGLVGVTRTFVGTYQMLPSPRIDSSYSAFLQAQLFGLSPQLATRLEMAQQFHNEIASVVDPKRMVYIAGSDQPTVVGVRDWDKVRLSDGYTISREGDGTVPHKFGLLTAPDGTPVPTFYVREEHGRLPVNPDVLRACEKILLGQLDNTGLSREPILERGGDARAEWEEQRQREQAEVEILAAELKVRGARAEPPPSVSPRERVIEELLLRQFLGGEVEVPALGAADGAEAANEDAASAETDATTVPPPPGSTKQPMPTIRVRVWHGSIADVGTAADLLAEGTPAVDAISVGHYTGVKPVNAELALDQAISAHLPTTRDGGSVLVHLSERGLFRGELGRPFLLPDPRLDSNGRTILVAGMGLPGRFGVPELKVLSREMTWSLSRLQKKHLATVLIGSGAGNLDIDQAVEGWLLGVRRALLDARDAEMPGLTIITFVEYSPGRALEMYESLQRAGEEFGKRLLDVQLESWPEEQSKRLRRESERERHDKRTKLSEMEPSRLTVELEGDAYEYGALTEDASVPQRHVTLDTALVHEGVDRLVAAHKPSDQLEYGEYLQRLLFPADFRSALSGEAPLVIVCDNTTAQVPWEMLTQPTTDGLLDANLPAQESYLSLRRGLTRQLRTTFAPPPDPPPPAQRILRVLVVADPSAEHPLPGAREEGWSVSQLITDYNELRSQETGNQIEAKILVGPGKATRTDVLKELLLHPYDVLHYAGHAEFNAEEPHRSGWIFSDVMAGGKQRHGLLTANELQRIDRVPRLIVSNACESGVLPDRPELRTPGAAPSFAEAFFARGVGEFVCTAWPVNDASALTFALTLYSELLGMQDKPKPMYLAMQEARLAVQRHKQGGRSWGAYQHYGNPNFRLFQ